MQEREGYMFGHPRGISDFFDALVAMKFPGREGGGRPAGGDLRLFTRQSIKHSVAYK